MQAAATKTTARRSHADVDGRTTRRPIGRRLASMHLLNFRRDASFEVDGERFDWARMRCCVGAHDGARELGAIVRAEVVEEPLAAKTEHLRGPVVVAATHAHLVQRRHVDPRVRRQAHLVLARGTAALLFDEQGHNPIGALARREWRTLVARALRARRCVGAHLHQLGGRIVAQPLAHLGRAASVTHGVVEGEPCLRAIAPDHTEVLKIVRGTSQSAHGVPVPLGSPPALSRARRRSSLRALLQLTSDIALSLSKGMAMGSASGLFSHSQKDTGHYREECRRKRTIFVTWTRAY